jgi:hypothetical protein
MAKTPRTKEEINNEYSVNCGMHGHKAQLLEQARKTVKTLEYEMEEHLKKGQALNREMQELPKEQAKSLTNFETGQTAEWTPEHPEGVLKDKDVVSA